MYKHLIFHELLEHVHHQILNYFKGSLEEVNFLEMSGLSLFEGVYSL